MRKIVLGIIIIITSLIFAQNSVLKEFSQAFADVAEKANPAVVTIITETEYKIEDFHRGLPKQWVKMYYTCLRIIATCY